MTQNYGTEGTDPGAMAPGLSGDDAHLEQLGYKSELSRGLGAFSSFALQYSTIAIVGAIGVSFGIGFSLSGPAMIWPWLVAGLFQILVASCVAEACSAYPLAGGAYSIVTRLGGRLIGWQVGWLVEIAHIVSISAGAVGISPLLLMLSGVEDPSTTTKTLVALALIVASTAVNLFRVKIVGWINNVGVSAEMLAAIIILVIGGALLLFGRLDGSAESSFSTEWISGNPTMPLLYSSILSVYILNGFDVSGTAGEETKDARRAIPRGLMFAAVGSYVLGTVIILILILANRDTAGAMASADPVGHILTPLIGSGLTNVFIGLAAFGLWICGVVLQLASARVMWAQSRDNILPFSRFFSRLNTEKVPVNGIVATGVISGLILLWSSVFAVLVAIVAIAWVGAYGVMIFTVLRAKMKGTFPVAEYRQPLWQLAYPVAGLWSAFICAVLIYQDVVNVGIGVAAVIAIGFLIYVVKRPWRHDAQETVVEVRYVTDVPDAVAPAQFSPRG